MNLVHALRQSSLLAAALVLVAPAWAHDTWVETNKGVYTVVFGHAGKLESYAPGKVKEIVALDAGGQALAVSQQAGSNGVTFTVPATPAMVTVSYDNGFWSQTVQGLKELPKNEAPGALSSSHAVKFSKVVYAWGPLVDKPRQQQLEIVPLDAAAPVAGKTLPVHVLWGGKPLAGVEIVRVDDSTVPPVKTDRDGKAMLAVSRGRQILGVSHVEALQGDARADSYSVSSNLVFDAR